MKLQPNVRSEGAKKHRETPECGVTAQINENIEFVIARFSGVLRMNPSATIGDARGLVGKEVVRDAR